jgi:hypothetical protein
VLHHPDFLRSSLPYMPIVLNGMMIDFHTEKVCIVVLVLDLCPISVYNQIYTR